VGNRTQQTQNGVARTSTYNKLNQLLSESSPSVTYAYEATGNRIKRQSATLTETLGYDFDNRLKTYTAGATSASYTSNGLGERVSKTVGGVTTTSYQDGPEVVLEKTGTSTTFYLRGPGIDDLIGRKVGVTWTYYHQDGLGSVVALTDAAGTILKSYAYEPFGSVRKTTGTIANPWTFTSRPVDTESSLLFLRNRSYDPRTGTFLTQDPIGIAGRINLYGYVGNNPLNLIDPFGLRVEIGERAVGPGSHTVIILIPDEGGPITTLSANPDYKPTWISPVFGTLTSTPNEPADAPQNLRNIQQISDPLNRSDAQLIADIMRSASEYQNNLPYDPTPWLFDPYSNSNSYVRGVLQDAGIPNPQNPKNIQPGWDKPISLPNKEK